MNEVDMAMLVDGVAKAISGAPFPSKQSLSKARKAVEIVLSFPLLDVPTLAEREQLRADRDQQRADKLEMAADAKRWAEEVGRLKADLVDARSQMLAVWNFLKPNASNDMEWADEILIALHERDALLHDAQRDAERLNWLDRNGFSAYRSIDAIDGLSKHCVVVHETMRPRRGRVADTIREAIDAAMAAEREGQG